MELALMVAPGIRAVSMGTVGRKYTERKLQLAYWLTGCTASSAWGHLQVTPTSPLQQRLALEAASGPCSALSADAWAREAFLAFRFPGCWVVMLSTLTFAPRVRTPIPFWVWPHPLGSDPHITSLPRWTS